MKLLKNLSLTHLTKKNTWCVCSDIRSEHCSVLLMLKNSFSYTLPINYRSTIGKCMGWRFRSKVLSVLWLRVIWGPFYTITRVKLTIEERICSVLNWRLTVQWSQCVSEHTAYIFFIPRDSSGRNNFTFLQLNRNT